MVLLFKIFEIRFVLIASIRIMYHENLAKMQRAKWEIFVAPLRDWQRTLSQPVVH